MIKLAVVRRQLVIVAKSPADGYELSRIELEADHVGKAIVGERFPATGSIALIVDLPDALQEECFSLEWSREKHPRQGVQWRAGSG